MGEGRSVSSLHKDHYENMYAVIRGTKKFTLFPPTARPFLPHRNYHSAYFVPLDETSTSQTTEEFVSRTFGIGNVSSEPAVPWIALDPDQDGSDCKVKVSRSPVEPLAKLFAYLPPGTLLAHTL